MQKLLLLIQIVLFTGIIPAKAQNSFYKYNIGHATIDIPLYMKPGPEAEAKIIDSTLIVFESKNIDYYTVIIVKEMPKTSSKLPALKDYARRIADNVTKYATGLSCLQTTPLLHTKGIVHFSEIEIDCKETRPHHDEAKYQFIGIAETKERYYSVSCVTPLFLKDKFKNDFKKVLYSIKESHTGETPGR